MRIFKKSKKIKETNQQLEKFKCLTEFTLDEFLKLYANGVIELKTSKAYNLLSLRIAIDKCSLDTILTVSKNLNDSLEDTFDYLEEDDDE